MGQQDFDPSGDTRNSSGTIGQTDVNYPGQVKDGSGLLYYHARYYDTFLGRFTSADSIVPQTKNPQDWNRYSYVNNNPLNLIDPTGHCGKRGQDSAEDCQSASNALLNYGFAVADINTWLVSELQLVMNAFNNFIAHAGWAIAQFRNVMAPNGNNVSLIRGHGNDAGDTGGGVGPDANMFVILNDGVFDSATSSDRRKAYIVHELGHVWDGRSNHQLADGMMEATGSGYTCTGNEGTDCTYVPGGSPASNYGGNTNHYEDWAEAVAASVYPQVGDYQTKDGKSQMGPIRSQYVQDAFDNYSGKSVGGNAN